MVECGIIKNPKGDIHMEFLTDIITRITDFINSIIESIRNLVGGFRDLGDGKLPSEDETAAE